MRTIPPGQVTQQLQRFQREQIVTSHVELSGETLLAGSSALDFAAAVAQLPGRFGGHGIMGFDADDPGSASYHDAAWYGSWAAVWHYIRRWVPPLHGRQLAQLGSTGGFAYRRA